ncbi:hypothetical protein CER18_04925 [Bartonella tribocorum]|uniref:Uncharacterized protein n=1 Tax=Bartonella tribocorum TaxID=85701 RepID=A0A2M6US76_9HYPH|nr:hypothetical protein CER18_04925 [Bartonella tribocorum]
MLIKRCTKYKRENYGFFASVFFVCGREDFLFIGFFKQECMFFVVIFCQYLIMGGVFFVGKSGFFAAVANISFLLKRCPLHIAKGESYIRIIGSS